MAWRLILAAGVLIGYCAPASAVYQQGVDVSTHQGSVNWSAMRSGGISFAFVKATEGVDFIDNTFVANMAGAKAAGVLIGPYHFARPDSFNTDPNDAANEANDFVDAIQPYYQGVNLTLRPVLDLERLANVGTTAQEKVFLSRWTRNFAAVVRTRLGVDPLIYLNRNYAQNYLESDISQFPLWIAKPISTSASAATQNDFTQASPPVSSELGIWNNASFWQWSWGGNVGGENPVDRDAFNGTMQQLSAYIPDFHAGDFDNDGVVDGRDYVRWRNSLNTSVNPGTAADADFSGMVDSADYSTWRANFGKTYAPGSGFGTTVPEPTGLLLLLVGAAVQLAVGWRRRSG